MDSILLRWTFVVILSGGLASSTSAADYVLRTQVHMGTKFIISVDTDETPELNDAIDAAYERVEQLDLLLSDYKSASEVVRLSRSAPHEQPVRVSPELFRVLSTAKSLSEQTGGAFDVTVGPLSKLWRRARRRHELPSAEYLERAKAAVGYQAMRLGRTKQTVQLTRQEMRIDLGAIAKGYAADEALRVLHEAGFPRTLINAGGDIRAGLAPRGTQGWKVGVAPLDAKAEPSRILHIANQAIATSGDAWQFVEIEGSRYSHIIDPRTGIGLTTRSSVTVMAPTGIAADSLASAISVLGPREGIGLADKTPCVSALVVYLEKDAVQTMASKRFPKE